jgi:hypothetical protein
MGAAVSTIPARVRAALPVIVVGAMIAVMWYSLTAPSQCIQMRTPFGNCVEPMLVGGLIGTALLALLLRAAAEYVVALVLIVFGLSVMRWESDASPAAATPPPQVRIATTDLANSAIVARPKDYETLTVDGGDGRRRTFLNLHVLDLLDKNGQSVAYTNVAPDAVVLAVEPSDYDEILDWLRGKKAALSLRPQLGPLTSTPAPPTPVVTPLPTAAPAAGQAVYALPVTKIQSGLELLASSTQLRVVLVVDRRDSDGRVLQQDSGAYLVSLLDVQDARGVRLQAPFERAAQVRVSLAGETVGPGTPAPATWQRFAEQLTGASAIYLLPG